MKMTVNRIRVVVLGSPRSGKSVHQCFDRGEEESFKKKDMEDQEPKQTSEIFETDEQGKSAAVELDPVIECGLTDSTLEYGLRRLPPSVCLMQFAVSSLVMDEAAVVVRYLTKRYIGEYSSTGDFLYQHRVSFDGAVSEVEILDTSNCALRGCLAEHVRWGDAFAVVYSVCSRRSFAAAGELLALLALERAHARLAVSPLAACAPAVMLLGNKRDLEHAREVQADEGQELSLRFGCQFYEVSAAEGCAGAALAFRALLREARALALLLPASKPTRRKLAAYSMSKVIGTIFGKNNKSVRKKRPSLSI